MKARYNYVKMPRQSFYSVGSRKHDVFGMGTRGNVVYSSTAQFPSHNAEYRNLTIKSGVTMTPPAGYYAMVIRCTGTFKLEGTINLSALIPGGSGGSNAGSGGNGEGGNGGAGGGMLIVYAKNIYIIGTINVAGGNGASGQTGYYGAGGGGGGGSGGLIVLCYLKSEDGSATYTLTAGNGGSGGATLGNDLLPPVDGHNGGVGSTITLFDTLRDAFTPAQGGAAGGGGGGGGKGGNRYAAGSGQHSDMEDTLENFTLDIYQQLITKHLAVGSGGGGGGGGTVNGAGTAGDAGATGLKKAIEMHLW